MDGLEEKLSSFLSDPSAMEQVLSLAKSLGLGGEAPPHPAPKAAPQPEQQPPQQFFAAMEDPMMQMLIGTLSEAANSSDSHTALLNALRPFVRSDRQKKLERAAQIAKMAHIAGAALKRYEKG